MKTIEGQDLIMTVGGKSALHAESHSLSMDMDVKEFRTIHTNGKKSIAGDMNWSVEVSGLITVDEDVLNAHTPEELISLFLAKQEVEVVVKSPLAGFTKHYTGNALITSMKIDGKAGENVTYSASLKGSGDLRPVTPPVTPPAG